MKRALIIPGGWPGHKPEDVAAMLVRELTAVGMDCEQSPTLDVFDKPVALRAFDVILPCWTMGQLTDDQTRALSDAVRGGVGLAGLHGGMGDAFRGNLEFEWMAGGHFVGHPHVGDYTVRVRDFTSPVTAGLPAAFHYRSEQYYMMIDPSIHVLAESDYIHDGRHCVMPVAWIKRWGQGRVFYSSLGHDPAEFAEFPDALRLLVNGIRWAARETGH